MIEEIKTSQTKVKASESDKQLQSYGRASWMNGEWGLNFHPFILGRMNGDEWIGRGYYSSRVIPIHPAYEMHGNGD